MPLMPLDIGVLQPQSTLGVAAEPYYVFETKVAYMFTMPVPGLSEGNITVKVINNRRLLIKSKAAVRFTPKFTYAFQMPSDVIRENISATVDNGVLLVRLIKNNH